MFNSVKAMLYLEPTAVTPMGATNLLGGVVEMLISPLLLDFGGNFASRSTWNR